MQTNKPALKRQREAHQAPASEKLVFQKPFEYFVPLPMQECIVRLKYATKEAAYIRRISPTEIEFNFAEWRRTYSLWAVGYLEEIRESQTRVVVKIGIPRIAMILTIFMTVVVISWFIFSDPLVLAEKCLMVGIMTPIWIGAFYLDYLLGRGNIMDKLRSMSIGTSKK